MRFLNRFQSMPCLTLSFVLLFSIEAAWAVTIDGSDFCVTDDAFHFDVEMTGDGEELVFRIGADADPFVSPNERIAMNFDTATGEFTRDPPLVPQVQTFGSPDFDRWMDGEIADFELTDLGDFRWRFTGSVPHGADPFSAGNMIWGVALRSFTSSDAIVRDVPVTACEPETIVLEVPRTPNLPTIDGELVLGEWSDAVMHDTDSGFIAFMHGLDRLYLLIDVLTDTGDDPFVQGGGDQFWLYFDIDEDGEITPDVDLRFRLESGFGNLRYQTFCEDCLFGFNPLEPSTSSSRGEGFGCFVEDFSLNLLPPKTCNEHRIWEVALDLGEIDMRDRTARFGYLIASGIPQFNESFPSNLNDLAAYGELTLEESPRQISLFGPGAMNPQFEVTQAIQTPSNDSDLVAGKPTAIRVWDTANNSTVKVFVYGQQNSIDLAGSPLLFVDQLFGTPFTFGPSDPRDTVDWNLTERLPEEWAEGGAIDFAVEIRGLDDSPVTILPPLQDNVVVAPTETPVFWTVPIINTLASGTVNQPTENFMAGQEQAMQRLVPIREIDLVRRPDLDVSNITTSAGLLQELKDYDQQAILAWTISLLLTGGNPGFDLPDQITGFSSTSLAGSGGTTAGGSSDPIWFSGNGRVNWIGPFASSGILGYVHELNHNLDTDPTGTWGRHSRGCGAAGPDGSWPYGTSFDIQEVGIQWTGTQFLSVRDTTPDVMSICQSPVNPVKWMAPYRWDAWLDLFRTDIAAAALLDPASTPETGVKKLNGFAKPRNHLSVEGVISGSEERFYVMGRVFPDGAGQLGQILRQAGPIQAGMEIGNYAVQILSCDNDVLYQARFTPSFIDVEGLPSDFFSFSFILSAPAESCAIELSGPGGVLDRRDISDNPPVVTLLTPNGGETWSGMETASWDASDDDGDDLSFNLFYSPDGGMNWLPVASGISGNSHGIDTSGLPGSNDARLRVLATDGANTTHDDSDESFTVAMKPPSVTILSPADNGIFDVNEPLNLEGIARNTFGKALPGDDLLWTIGNVPVGVGEMLSINLDEGDYTIVLSAEDADGMVGSAAVDITMADLGAVEDPVDVDLPAVDLAEAQAFIADDRLVCEMSVRSGEFGLRSRSRFACHIDFDDLEHEMDSGCDANGDGELINGYRLGSNGSCSTSDTALMYRHDRRGGACTGGPGVMCATIEFNADGASDEECDGTVAGQPAVSCQVIITGLLTTIAEERDAQCADPEDGCLGGVNEFTGSYRAYNFFEAHYQGYKDWLPDTDDGESPNSTNEVLLIPLMQ